MGNGEEGKDEYEEWAKWMRPPEKKLLEAISINTTFKWMPEWSKLSEIIFQKIYVVYWSLNLFRNFTKKRYNVIGIGLKMNKIEYIPQKDSNERKKIRVNK